MDLSAGRGKGLGASLLLPPAPRCRPGGGGGPRTAVESVCATGDLDLPRRRAFVTHIGEAEEGEATAEKKGRRDADSVLALLRWSPSTPSREPR
jgi:hypothetical protein